MSVARWLPWVLLAAPVVGGEPALEWKELEALVARLEAAPDEGARGALQGELFERAGRFLDRHLDTAGEEERCRRAAAWWFGLAPGREGLEPAAVEARIAAVRARLAPLPPQLARALEVAGARARVRPGEPAPEWTARTVEGAELSSRALRGKLLLLSFWATWSPPCLKLAEARLLPLQARHAGRLAIVAVGAATNGDTPERQARVARRLALPWPHLFDEEDRIALAHGVDSWPYLVLIDAEGKVLLAGAGTAVVDEVERRVAAALAPDPAEGEKEEEPKRGKGAR